MTKELLLIFTRNPVLGKVKTRLAAKVGDVTALRIYEFLLAHTVEISTGIEVAKRVCYSEKVNPADNWSNVQFEKAAQQGEDLGERMLNAFKKGFEEGYERIVIIGSDMYDLSSNDLREAFKELVKNDVVVGPAEDGGYYLLGLKHLVPGIFENKSWGTNSVLSDTLNDLKGYQVKLLDSKNDVDQYEDIKDHPAFQHFITPIKTTQDT